MSTTRGTARFLSSISFSGSGFLCSYHLGVASCLIGQNILPSFETEEGEAYSSSLSSPRTIICGSSAGSMIASAIASGVHTDDGMNILLKIAKKTRESCGFLNFLTPGFSLIDQAAPLLFTAIKNATNSDKELLLNRLQHIKPRIALTHPKTYLNPMRSNMDAYRYVDEFNDIKDLVASSILSSYIPGCTGPLLLNRENNAVTRSFERFRKHSIKVKDGNFHHAIDLDSDFERGNSDISVGDGRLMDIYWDGGLSNMWPVVDKSTLVVSPLTGIFSPNTAITPTPTTANMLTVRRTNTASCEISRKNIEASMKMVLSPDDHLLEEWFSSGYDDASLLLRKNNMTNCFLI